MVEIYSLASKSDYSFSFTSYEVLVFDANPDMN